MAIIYKNGIAYGNQRVLDATLTQQGEDADAKAVGDALALKAGTGVIADDFSTSQSYAIGDYTYYNGSLYRFTAAHSAGAWVGTDAQAVQLAEDVVDLKNTLNHKADVIYDTASGDIASFHDGADGLPAKDLTVAIEPVQDTSGGDPSPTHICPISGWTGANVSRTGKNILKNGIAPGTTWGNSEISFLANSDGSITINGMRSSTAMVVYNFEIGDVSSTSSQNHERRTLIPGNYIINEDSNIVFQLCKSNTSGNSDLVVDYIRGAFTVTDEYKYNWVRLQAKKNTTYSNYKVYPMIRTVLESDAAYKPYTGTTIPISWQSEAGTVYAASLDALAGKLKTRPYYASYNGETLVGPWISSMDVYTPGGTPTTGAQVVDLGGAETEYTIDPVTISTLLGQNNIWADCGPVSVEYPCDTKLYIQKINAPTDDDMIADANIASGQYFIVNNNLYISTAAILAGDPIKPGTNCTLTNLAAALNAINS